jgi:hypothetical protein
MAVFKCKGMALSMTIASSLTPIGQIMSFDEGDVERQTFEADTLDNSQAGIIYGATGRVEPGKISGELFLDKNDSGQAGLVAFITTPSAASSVGQVTYASPAVGSGSLAPGTFTVVGASLGLTVALKEGLKAKFSLKLSGNVAL